MRTGQVVRGSIPHQILSELERYPDRWYRWYQFPELDATEGAIQRAMARLRVDGTVEHQTVPVFDDDWRHRYYLEIRYKGLDV